MASWLRGQQSGRPGAGPRGSAALNGFMGMQSQCQEAMAHLFDMVNAPGHAGGEMAFQRAVQRKNECFARALCPGPVAAAHECVLDPQRAARGECDAPLQSASACVRGFWETALNARVEEGMGRYTACAEQCGEALRAQQSCLARVGIQRAPRECQMERRAAELCLGGCLRPDLQSQLDECRQTPGSDCQSAENRVVAARGQAARSVLRDMGFAEQELAAPGAVEQLMDVAGMLIFTSILEDRSDLGK